MLPDLFREEQGIVRKLPTELLSRIDFIKKVNIDFIVIDEVHFSKQREVENLSIRKKNITSMITKLRQSIINSGH